jgi:hypothetical protein
MAIKQLSVFVENKQGSLHEITDALAKANICSLVMLTGGSGIRVCNFQSSKYIGFSSF